MPLRGGWLVTKELEVSDELLYSSDTEGSTGSTSMAMIKEIILDGHYYGVLRVKFDMADNDGASGVNGQIYRDGSAVGTLQSRSTAGSGTWGTYSEDIGVGNRWCPDDKIQLYGKRSESGTANFKNFRVYGSEV